MSSKTKDSRAFLGNNNNHMATKPDEEVISEDEVYCGIGGCRPTALQCCATMGVFSAMYSLSGLLTSTVSIYINSQITTLEKQFGFSSSVSGFLLSCNDIGYLLTTLAMSYIARRTHIPRVLGLSTILFGVSGLICSIPYFATKNDLHPWVNSTGMNTSRLLGGRFCTIGQSHSISNFSDGDTCLDRLDSASIANIPESTRSFAIALIAIGMILQGFGKSPRYPFIATYVDDNVEKTKTTLYLGIITGLSIFGPAIAFTLGGVFSKIPVTLEATTLTPRDPRWIGAWWLGFLVFGIGGVLASIPLFFFPRRIKPRDRTVAQIEERRRISFKRDVTELLKAVIRLLTNPIYMCMVFGACLNLFAISGMLSFLPKYIEVQFQIPAWKANIILGALNLIAAAGGSMLGGIITSKLKMRPITCIIFLTVINSVSVLLSSSGFFLGCSQPDIVGHHTTQLISNTTTPPLTCTSSCGCDVNDFFPVCGEDGMSYQSPCHAGCPSSDTEYYTGCACISGNSTAVPGLCESGCSNLYPYIAVMFFGAFTATLGMMPGFIVTIRSVTEADKPLAIGLSAFLNTLLGWFPGPVFFGKIIDTTCRTWATSCSGSGACLLYSLLDLKLKYHAGFCVTRGSSVLLYFVALFVAKKKKRPFYLETPKSDSAEKEKFIVKNGVNGELRHSKV
ncbi:solute carrier organic anion transporter family member 2A1-like [Haliotis rufescens]|uniref:solute carrier organic anion transporter family member 2A1-like n=1 Tax=Haliotis rufescens TaxID=6454 RepID=UPI00201E8426|nr:solute carrier organic anion transporter family member 2A1-like [Haliotis rufescens]